MEKLKEIEFDVRRYRVPGIYNNKYDHLFDQNRILYGQGIYMTHKIDNLSIDKDVVTSVVHGTTDYNVKIKFLPNDEIEVHCECPYHKETNKYCKHIYATLIAVHMKDIREERIKEFHDNIDKTKKIMEDYSKLIEDNKQYLSILTNALLPSTPISYLNKVKEMEEKFDPNKENIVLDIAQESRWNLKSAIEHYNKLIDFIIEDKEEYEENQKKKLKEEKEQMIRDNVEKARIKKEQDKTASLFRKAARRGIISGIFSGLLGTPNSPNPDLNPWEQDFIDSNAYEPFQFEEEDLEEDDFYNEDD